MTWSKSDIRRARKVELAPLLARRGLQLKRLANDNFLVVRYDDLIIKKSYWRWPSRDIYGNAIDFFILVQEMSFFQAMKLLSPYIDSIECDRPEPGENIVPNSRRIFLVPGAPNST